MSATEAIGSSRVDNRFSVYAWGVLVFTFFVILWGAYVRATGSGAGCGEHWPLCDGQVIPRAPHLAQMIEFTHRATSGLYLIAVVGLLVWARKRYPIEHPVRTWSMTALILTIVEALIGAGLVLLGLTAENQSSARAVVIAFHLVNTFFLNASLIGVIFFSTGAASQVTLKWFLRDGIKRFLLQPRARHDVLYASVIFFLLLWVGASGAIAALGNTLFPSTSFIDGVTQDFSTTSHILLRLRIFHPVLAVAACILIGAFCFRIQAAVRKPHVSEIQRADLMRATTVALGSVGLTVVIGLLNLALLAPVWAQLIHLTSALVLWCSSIYVMFCWFTAGQSITSGFLESKKAVVTSPL